MHPHDVIYNQTYDKIHALFMFTRRNTQNLWSIVQEIRLNLLKIPEYNLTYHGIIVWFRGSKNMRICLYNLK